MHEPCQGAQADVIDAGLAAKPDKRCAGKDKMFSFFVGQMRARNGGANPALVNEAIRRKLG